MEFFETDVVNKGGICVGPHVLQSPRSARRLHAEIGMSRNIVLAQ